MRNFHNIEKSHVSLTSYAYRGWDAQGVTFFVYRQGRKWAARNADCSLWYYTDTLSELSAKLENRYK